MIGKKWTTRGLLGPLVVTGWARIRHAPFGIELSLLVFTFFRSIVPVGSPGGALSAVMLPAAERAAKIPTSPISGIGQKEYPAMLASRQIPSKMWLGIQN